MTNTPAPMSKDFRTGLAVGVIIACALGVAYLIGFGNDENSLHVSSLSWFFFTALTVLGANYIATVTPEILKYNNNNNVTKQNN